MKSKFKTFSYKDISAYELIEEIDYIKPISLKNNKRLVNRVHKRYPFIKKYQIALIIRAAFYIMRAELLKNKILYLGSFISMLYVRMGKRTTKHQGTYPLLKVIASTPKKIKKIKYV